MKKPKISDFCYDALLEYCIVLLDIINGLPDEKEIKERDDYRKAYANFNDSMGEYFDEKFKCLDEKEAKQEKMERKLANK